jgi:hypothetical protein
MKRLLWIVILLGIALVIATVGLHGWWLYSAPVAEHRSIVWPGGTASSASHTIRVELAQDLAATGATCGFQGAGEEVDQILFLRTEKALVQVKLTAAAQPLDGAGLCYALYDRDGQLLGYGRLPLDQPLAAQESKTVAIHDARTRDAWRIVLYRAAD